MAAQENHAEVVKYLLANNANQALATEVCVSVYYLDFKVSFLLFL